MHYMMHEEILLQLPRNACIYKNQAKQSKIGVKIIKLQPKNINNNTKCILYCILRTLHIAFVFECYSLFMFHLRIISMKVIMQ